MRPDKVTVGDFPEESLEDLLGLDDEIWYQYVYIK